MIYNKIGLIGIAGAGKDLVASIIQEKHPDYENFKYAGVLKQLCSELFEIPPTNFEDRTLKEIEQVVVVTGDIYSHFHYLTSTLLGIHLTGEEVKENVNELLVLLETTPLTTTLYDNKAYAFIKTPRRIMQIIGTDLFREQIKETAWVDTIESVDKVVCSDVRFPNEAEKIKELGGINIKLVNLNQQGKQTMNHQSEAFIDEMEYDYLIEHDGVDEEALRQQIYELLEELNTEQECSK